MIFQFGDTQNYAYISYQNPLGGVLLQLQQVQFGIIPNYVTNFDRIYDKLFPFEETRTGLLD